jgi:predicted HTH transcriptional regulator
MIQKLSPDDVLAALRHAPEQCIFDWKQDLLARTEEAKGEVLKDIVAVANATTTSPGFLFYGVDPRRPDPVVGMSKSYDDASFQQMFAEKVTPPVGFLYYEVALGAKAVGVFHIPASQNRPHIVTKSFGKLREGQILIRRGSSTAGINRNELFAMFYGEDSPYFRQILNKIGFAALQEQVEVAKMREYREQMSFLLGQAEITGGLPPGSLGSR